MSRCPIDGSRCSGFLFSPSCFLMPSSGACRFSNHCCAWAVPTAWPHCAESGVFPLSCCARDARHGAALKACLDLFFQVANYKLGHGNLLLIDGEISDEGIGPQSRLGAVTSVGGPGTFNSWDVRKSNPVLMFQQNELEWTLRIPSTRLGTKNVPTLAKPPAIPTACLTLAAQRQCCQCAWCAGCWSAG